MTETAFPMTLDHYVSALIRFVSHEVEYRCRTWHRPGMRHQAREPEVPLETQHIITCMLTLILFAALAMDIQLTSFAVPCNPFFA